MKIKVREKHNNEERQLDAIYFNADGSIGHVVTIDPTTGHDPQDHLPEELVWDVRLDEKDIESMHIVEY